jgi:hypothetical protein
MIQLGRAGYSVRKSQAHQDRIIVTRGRLTWSLAVLSDCVARDRVTQLLGLAASQPSRPQPDRQTANFDSRRRDERHAQ